jgi:hypothetical protein
VNKGFTTTRIVEEDIPVDVVGNTASILTTIACPAGTKVVGGGMSVDDDDWHLSASHPTSMNGWALAAKNPGGTSGTVTGYAVCVD